MAAERVPLTAAEREELARLVIACLIDAWRRRQQEQKQAA